MVICGKQLFRSAPSYCRNIIDTEGGKWVSLPLDLPLIYRGDVATMGMDIGFMIVTVTRFTLKTIITRLTATVGFIVTEYD